MRNEAGQGAGDGESDGLEPSKKWRWRLHGGRTRRQMSQAGVGVVVPGDVASNRERVARRTRGQRRGGILGGAAGGD